MSRRSAGSVLRLLKGVCSHRSELQVPPSTHTKIDFTQTPSPEELRQTHVFVVWANGKREWVRKTDPRVADVIIENILKQMEKELFDDWWWDNL